MKFDVYTRNGGTKESRGDRDQLLLFNDKPGFFHKGSVRGPHRRHFQQSDLRYNSIPRRNQLLIGPLIGTKQAQRTRPPFLALKPCSQPNCQLACQSTPAHCFNMKILRVCNSEGEISCNKQSCQNLVPKKRASPQAIYCLLHPTIRSTNQHKAHY